MPSDYPLPIDWESRYQSSDTPWDKGVPHPLAAGMVVPPAQAGAVLVPGCGTGTDLVALAETWPDRMIVGVDIAASAVAAARRRVAGFPLVQVRCADVFAAGITEGIGTVAMIWEHTCFCAIPPALRPAYVAMAASVLAPGGELRGVFFLTLDDGGSGPPWNCPEEELRGLFGPWFDIVRVDPSAATYPGREHSEWQVHMTRKAP